MGEKASGFNTEAPLAWREGLPSTTVLQCLYPQHMDGSKVEEGYLLFTVGVPVIPLTPSLLISLEHGK